MSTGYFDIETQYLFAEVGGRSGLEKLRLSVAGLIIDDEPCRFFEEEDASDLLEALLDLDKIVGHNLFRFDYPVLRPYDEDNIIIKLLPKTIDTWAIMQQKTGDMVSLNNLARENVGFVKSGYGGDMPRLWREGKKEEVKEYNRHDVELTKAVYLFGRQKGYVWYKGLVKDDSGKPVLADNGEKIRERRKVEVDW